MSEENENVEIITKIPEKTEKTKNPQKIEIGRKLAAYNKKAKENKKEEETEENNQKNYIPSLVQISAVFGILVMGMNIFLQYKQIYPTQHKEKFLEPEKQNHVESETEKPKVNFGME